MILLSEPLTVAVQSFNQGRYLAEMLESIFRPCVKSKINKQQA